MTEAQPKANESLQRTFGSRALWSPWNISRRLSNAAEFERSLACVLFAVFCGFSGCEKPAIRPPSGQTAAEAAAIEKFKGQSVKLTEWAKEHRPKQKWPPRDVINWEFAAHFEAGLKQLANKNLPDDLKRALEEYISTFQEHPDRVNAPSDSADYKRFSRRLPASGYGRQIKAFAAKILPVGERLVAAAAKYGVNLEELVSAW